MKFEQKVEKIDNFYQISGSPLIFHRKNQPLIPARLTLSSIRIKTIKQVKYIANYKEKKTKTDET